MRTQHNNGWLFLGPSAELSYAHLLNEDGLGCRDATTTSQTIIKGYGCLSDLLSLQRCLHQRLDALLRRSNVVIDVGQFYDSCKHPKK